MKIVRAICSLGLLVIAFPALAAQNHIDKTLTIVHASDGRPCTFFQLAGVSEADPVSLGSPWFALSMSHVGYKDIMAMLVTAKAMQLPIQVTTSGQLACGLSAVTTVLLR